MLVMVTSAMCRTRLSSVLQATCLIARLLPRATMLEVTEMMACLTFMIHMLDESLSNSGQPRDCHVRYNLFHSKYKLICYIVTMGDTSWTIRRQTVMR